MYYSDEINEVVLEQGEDQCFTCAEKMRCPLLDAVYNRVVVLCEEGIYVSGCAFHREIPVKLVPKKKEGE